MRIGQQIASNVKNVMLLLFLQLCLIPEMLEDFGFDVLAFLASCVRIMKSIPRTIEAALMAELESCGGANPSHTVSNWAEADVASHENTPMYFQSNLF